MSTPPLTRTSVLEAHDRIKPYIHLTPVLTNTTLSALASTPQLASALQGTEYQGQEPARPKFKFFFKCENYQKIGAFKARGAFHALSRLSDAEKSKGVVTHSSGNHAQALAFAARTHGLTAHIIMPTISTPSKIAATKGYGATVYFSGSTHEERQAVLDEVVSKTGATFVPPYDHPNILLGQGTMALELESQVAQLVKEKPDLAFGGRQKLDAVIAPCGGGGMLSGVATALTGTGTKVFGAEPRFQGANDAELGLERGERITHVKTLTIADGLRTPLGEITWSVISDKSKVQGVYSVTEGQIRSAMKLVLERMKVFIEPSAAVGLAVCLYNEKFRRLVEKEGGNNGWNMGVVFSGGNTALEAIAEIFRTGEEEGERAGGKVGRDGTRIAEDVAG